MKTLINEKNVIQLEEVFNPIELKTPNGEKMTISMRDGGFEFQYEGQWYYAKDGMIYSSKNSKNQ